MSPLIYEGTMRIVRKLGYPAFVKNAPLIILIAIGIIGGVGANLSGVNVLISFFSTFPTCFGSYRLTEYGRNALGIDCTEYLKELALEEKYSLPERPLVLEAETNQNSKVSLSLSKPTRHETFVSTAPGQELHYEEKVKIETLGGFYKKEIQLNGEKRLIYKPHQSSKKPPLTESKYIPLKDRTKTMADVRDHVLKEQIAIRILDEFLE